MEQYKDLFNLWDKNAEEDKDSGADLKYQIEEAADNWALFDNPN